jgi:hypothetical protein
MYQKGVITDFKGVEHPFIVCALSTSEFNNNPDYEVGLAVYDTQLEDYCSETEFPRAVFIGVAVCNPGTDTKPGDEWNEEKGKKIALCKAKGFKFERPEKSAALFATRAGMISEILVSALLTKEVDHIKEDPECVIPGYNQMKARWEQKLHAQKYLEETPDNLRKIGETLSTLKEEEIERVINVALIKSDEQQ